MTEITSNLTFNYRQMYAMTIFKENFYIYLEEIKMINDFQLL